MEFRNLQTKVAYNSLLKHESFENANWQDNNHLRMSWLDRIIEFRK